MTWDQSFTTGQETHAMFNIDGEPTDDDQIIISSNTNPDDTFVIDHAAANEDINKILRLVLTDTGIMAGNKLGQLLATTQSPAYCRIVADNVIERAEEYLRDHAPRDTVRFVAQTISTFAARARKLTGQQGQEST